MNTVEITESTSTPTLVAPVAAVKRGPGRPKTKITLKRVVLVDGAPVGRGRPALETKSVRTVVFIPVDETFNASVHGVGKKYIAGLAQYKLAIKRVDISKFRKLLKATA